MNLVQNAWLPFRLRDGSEKILPLREIANSDVVDFALPRADFQGAAYQLVIGLLQTVIAPKNKTQWNTHYSTPPDKECLQQAFDTVSHAFQMLGDGSLFMQDFDTLQQAEPETVSGLLIDAPGENTLKKNIDHFVKRGIGSVMSLEMAVMALFTLQINAPSGGAGYRVGLRGGGPLTTLVLPLEGEASLWQKLWLNVISRDRWPYPEPDLHSAMVFPWLAATRSSDKKGTEIYASDVHPLQMYWAMPRRIRLIVQEETQICQISGRTAPLTVTAIRTQNYGNNYSGSWDHPLTPYRWDIKKPDAERLSIKGQPGGITYKIWHLLTFSHSEAGQSRARVVENFYALGSVFRQWKRPMRLWAFGYDMDNMKPRGWYSSMMPLVEISEEQQKMLQQVIRECQILADKILSCCRGQIKEAWGNVKGDLSFIDTAFWQRSEADFFALVAKMVDRASHAAPLLTPELAKGWLGDLRRLACTLFDEYALAIDYGDVISMADQFKARQKLTGLLDGVKEIKQFVANYILVEVLQ